MKILKPIFFVVMILLVGKTNAQVNYKYDTCDLNIYRQFEGEWKYYNGNDTIRFYLRAHRIFSPRGEFGEIYIHDRLLGWHQFKRDNTIVESTYENRFMSIPSDRYILPRLAISIDLAIDRNFGPNSISSRRLYGSIHDIGLFGEMIKVFSAIFSSNLQTLEWSQWRTDFSRNPESAIMTLPCCFTLTKQ